MKNTKWLAALGAALLPLVSVHAQPSIPQPPPEAGPPPAAPSVPTDLTPAANEVIRLSEAGTGEDVTLAYIQRASVPFNLSADDILYLRDIGLSSPVITAMLNRDHDLQGQGQTYTYDQRLYPAANPGAVAPQPISPPPPEPAVATPPPTPDTPPPTYVTTPPPEVTYFYNDLSPYGTWVQLEGYGWCWQPRVVVINRAWRPYCDSGYWVYSDCGWYWQSSYSWGWAPFHYGRWEMHPRCGWVWLPDRVWAPAWVLWRSEGDHCGWAPLPPHAEFVAGFGWRFNGVHVGIDFDFGLRPEHFTFVGLRDFNDHDLGRRRLAPTQVTQIYNHTTIINNYTVNNNTIVNQGIKVERVAAATHTQIRPVPIRDTPAGNTPIARTQGTVRGSPVIYRPQLKAAPTRPANMVAQKVDDRHPTIQHTSTLATKVPSPTRPVTPPRSPAVTTRPMQQPDTRNFSRPAPNTTREQEPPTRRTYPTAPSAPSAPPASRNTSQVAPKPFDQERLPSQRPAPESQPPPSRGARPAPQEYNPHQYYPKSYHQAAEVHSLPPVNSRPSSQPMPPDRGNSQSHRDDSGPKH